MKKILTIITILICSMIMFSSLPVYATSDSTTTEQSEDSAVWKTKKGKTYYYVNGVKQTGWQTIKNKTYHFTRKGVMQTGWQKLDGKKYYFSNKGVMQKGLKTIKNKKYYFDANGVMQTGLLQVGSKTYYFDKKGIMKTGWQTVSGNKYYFSSKGVAQTGLKTIKSKKYYFDQSGIMQKGFQTIKNKTYYFDKKGIMKTGWRKLSGNKYYFSSKGVMQTYWKKIKGKKYYFGSDGKMVKNTALIIDGVYYIFNSKGIYDPSVSYFTINGVKVHAQYKTDAQVSAEQLLATIIYCEAGNQKQYPVSGIVDGNNVTVYKGQLAVGYVIANRRKSNMDFKEVIYQVNQFEPARTGVLTKYLNNYSAVSTECKNAAKIILNDVSTNSNSVPGYMRSDCKWKNFWATSYANKTNFFSVYNDSEYEIIQGHVFFNYTKLISK